MLRAPFTTILRLTAKPTGLVKFNVPNVKSRPLPCNVIFPAPRLGEAFSCKPPLNVNVPPVPGVVFSTPLTMSVVAVPAELFAALAVMAPPFVLMPADPIVKTRSELSGDSVVRLTAPPCVVIAAVVVRAPVFVIEI